MDFLAKWLLNYSKTERMVDDRHEQIALVEMQIKQHAEAREKLSTEQAERTKVQNANEREKAKFFDQIADAHDLSDYLQELTDYL